VAFSTRLDDLCSIQQFYIELPSKREARDNRPCDTLQLWEQIACFLHLQYFFTTLGEVRFGVSPHAAVYQLLATSK